MAAAAAAAAADQVDWAPLEGAMSALENAVGPAMDQDIESLATDMTPLQKAELNVALAYAVNSLWFMRLKACGANTAGHPVLKELERVRGHVKKVKTAMAAAAAKEPAAEATAKAATPAPQAESNSRVDIAAAKRFIHSALNGQPNQEMPSLQSSQEVDFSVR